MESTINEKAKRSAGVDLATKVSFLREEVRRGGGANIEELIIKERSLVDLFADEVPTNAGYIDFLVRDTSEKTDNLSSWKFCRRIVRVLNPRCELGAEKTFNVDLLSPGSENLADAGVSEPIPNLNPRP